MAYYLETALVRGNSLHPQQPYQVAHGMTHFPPCPICGQPSPLPRAALPAVMLRPSPYAR